METRANVTEQTKKEILFINGTKSKYTDELKEKILDMTRVQDMKGNLKVRSVTGIENLTEVVYLDSENNENNFIISGKESGYSMNRISQDTIKLSKNL